MNFADNHLPKKFRSLEYRFLLGLLPYYRINVLTKQYQIGGKNGSQMEKNIKFNDKTGIFTFKVSVSIDENRIQLSVLSTDDIDCVTVFIEPIKHLAILHNIGFYENCAKEGLKKPGGGSVLLRFVLNHLTNNKELYKINKIALTDHSYLPCSNCDDNVQLARLRQITHGETWYMKYGFKPYNAEKDISDTRTLEAIEYNNNKLKTLNTNIISNVKMNKYIKQLDKKELHRLTIKYPLLKDFIIRLSTEYNKYCCLFVYILKNLYETAVGKKSILEDIYDKSYFLDI